jgi:hypothetical protein
VLSAVCSRASVNASVAKGVVAQKVASLKNARPSRHSENKWRTRTIFYDFSKNNSTNFCATGSKIPNLQIKIGWDTQGRGLGCGQQSARLDSRTVRGTNVATSLPGC